MTVYFAQACGGGPIKIGASIRPQVRRSQLGAWIPQGVELITTIPGYLTRESYLKAALRPWLLNGEWFKSCIPIWRVIIDAVEHKDICWLPDPGALSDYGDQHAKVLELAATIGIKPPPHYGCYGHQVLGKYLFVADLKTGALPDWLIEAHREPDSEVAA